MSMFYCGICTYKQSQKIQTGAVSQIYHIWEAVMNSSKVLQLYHSVKSPHVRKNKYIEMEELIHLHMNSSLIIQWNS